MFSCAICFDEHSMEDCYVASACGHCMCRDAARKVVLGAVRYTSGSASSARNICHITDAWLLVQWATACPEM